MEKNLIQDYINTALEEKLKIEQKSLDAMDNNRKKLPYGADSERQIPVKRELRKARNWKPGF